MGVGGWGLGDLPAAHEQQALEHMKLKRNAGAAGCLVILLLFFLVQARLQHWNDLDCGRREGHDESGPVVQDDGADAVEVDHDGARAGEDGRGAAEFAVDYANVPACKPRLHLEGAAVELALLRAAVGVYDGGDERALL